MESDQKSSRSIKENKNQILCYKSPYCLVKLSRSIAKYLQNNINKTDLRLRVIEKGKYFLSPPSHKQRKYSLSLITYTFPFWICQYTAAEYKVRPN